MDNQHREFTSAEFGVDACNCKPAELATANPDTMSSGCVRALQEEVERLRAALKERLEAAEKEKCEHGWRGATPERGDRIRTPCPACGLRALFIGSGGHLTCSSVPSDGAPGCPSPSVQTTWDNQRARIGAALAKARQMNKESMSVGNAELFSELVEALRGEDV